MFASKNRLKLPTSWKKAKPDYQIYSPLFKLIAKKVVTNSSPKVGFIISGKVGKATVRNRLRRKMTGVISQALDNLEPSLEIVFLVSTKAPEVNNEELSAEVNKALSKISLSRPRVTS